MREIVKTAQTLTPIAQPNIDSLIDSFISDQDVKQSSKTSIEEPLSSI